MPDARAKAPRTLLLLYALELALLFAHEVDAAYWREWELFGLGGDIQPFALAHIPLLLGGLWGYGALAEGRRGGRAASALVGAAGILAAAIHGFFLIRGHPSFRVPGSLAILAGGALCAVPLLALTFRAWRAPLPAQR